MLERGIRNNTKGEEWEAKENATERKGRQEGGMGDSSMLMKEIGRI